MISNPATWCRDCWQCYSVAIVLSVEFCISSRISVNHSLWMSHFNFWLSLSLSESLSERLSQKLKWLNVLWNSISTAQWKWRSPAITDNSHDACTSVTQTLDCSAAYPCNLWWPKRDICKLFSIIFLLYILVRTIVYNCTKRYCSFTKPWITTTIEQLKYLANTHIATRDILLSYLYCSHNEYTLDSCACVLYSYCTGRAKKVTPGKNSISLELL